MKLTDYAPRAAPFDSYLMSGSHLTGVEVGVDVGAHAHALLEYCPIAMLYLVDPWPHRKAREYCENRLRQYGERYQLMPMGSLDAATALTRAESWLDFVYVDQEHDAESVAADLKAWWPLVRPGGVLGHRNYAEGRGAPLDTAIENFVAENRIRTKVERYLNDIVLFK